MQMPADLRYTKDHEWVRLEADGTVTMGITDFAQGSLGDIVYVELPGAGTAVSHGSRCGSDSRKGACACGGPCCEPAPSAAASIPSAATRDLPLDGL